MDGDGCASEYICRHDVLVTTGRRSVLGIERISNFARSSKDGDIGRKVGADGGAEGSRVCNGLWGGKGDGQGLKTNAIWVLEVKRCARMKRGRVGHR